MASVVSPAAEGRRPASASAHPLDPLTPAEIGAAAAAVKAERGLGPDARFVYVSLYEPTKHEVIAFEQGGSAPERQAKVVVRERAERATYEGIVVLAEDPATVASWRRVPGVQPSVMPEEFLAAENLVRGDPRWQDAMRRRGVTDFGNTMIDPWSSPNTAPGLGPGDGRFLRPLTWVMSDEDDNGYAHPVEGLITLIDLDTMTVVEVEDHGAVPIPERPANYSARGITDPENVPHFPAGPRRDVKPLDITQPDGPSFTVDGYHLRWQKWDLRIGFTPREGLVLHRISYDTRSIIHRASLSEMFVPYGDPSPTQYRKLVLDEGEYGIGLMTNSLELGCDCLGEIRYLDGVVNDNDGNAVTMPNAICLHEEDHGIAWKHVNFRNGYTEVRRMRRMVISSIVTVGNYEYAYYWYLYQDGSLQYEVKLTGVISNGVVADGEDPRHGTVVAPGVYGPNHQHFFNVRLDMAVDGASNRVYEVTPTALPEGPGNPVGNAWVTEEALIENEDQARRDADPLRGRYWKIANDGVRNALGQPVAYKLVPEHTIAPFARPGSVVAERAAFISHPLWVTAYDRDEMFATGDYPNQSAGGGGLPAYVAKGRGLVDTDVVLWFTFGTNHVVRPEDWPVMPVHPIGFRLLPVGFFAGNPALDNPPPAGDHCHNH
ncbi:MAG: primary-amine oxidase [Nocardiopsaceae bacterium]|nr:primary-amine oxidase [Nocardiopsaceae bacterium]